MNTRRFTTFPDREYILPYQLNGRIFVNLLSLGANLLTSVYARSNLAG